MRFLVHEAGGRCYCLVRFRLEKHSAILLPRKRIDLLRRMSHMCEIISMRYQSVYSVLIVRGFTMDNNVNVDSATYYYLRKTAQ